MKTDLFQSCGHCWVFQICWHIECSTFTALSVFLIKKIKKNCIGVWLISNCQHPLDHRKKQENSRKIFTSASQTTLKPLTVWITTNWDILKEIRIPDHLSYLLRNLYTGQEATVRTRHGMMDWFQIGKGVHQGCILSPWSFNLYPEYIMWNTRLGEAQAGIKISRRNINNLRYTDDSTLMADSKEELKNLLRKGKEASEESGLKLNIQKMKIMASSPITSWQIDGETRETVTEFILGGFKIIADGDCKHEIRRCLVLGRKAMTNLDSILKSRDITLLTNVCLVKAMVFPVVMYGCESWTIKKAEHWRIDAFELWCWRRLLRVPWTTRRWNQSILKKINPEYSLECPCWSWSSSTLATWCEELAH